MCVETTTFDRRVGAGGEQHASNGLISVGLILLLCLHLRGFCGTLLCITLCGIRFVLWLCRGVSSRGNWPACCGIHFRGSYRRKLSLVAFTAEEVRM